MKKALLLLAASIVLTFSAACVSAEDYMPTEDKYSIVYNVGEENAAGMYGMVAIKGTDTIIDTSDLENIYYIKQASADAEGNIKFLDFAPKGAAPSDADFAECTVFIGGPGLDSAEAIGVLKKAASAPVEPDEPEDPEDPTYTISGKVISTVGTPKATVTVKDVSGATIATAQTAEDGSYSVPVAAGECYGVVITKTSYCSYSIAGINVAADVVLGDADISTLAGDVDLTEDINFYDLNAVINDYGKKVENATNPAADIDETKDINFYDLNTVIANYSKKAISQNFAQ